MRGEQYLTKRTQYRLLYDEGKSWVSGLVVMKALPNGRALARYGLSVSRRVGNAVVRNRVKRLLREVLRLIPIEPGWDMVFIARPAAAAAGYDDIKRSATGLLSRAGLLKTAGNNSGEFGDGNG